MPDFVIANNETIPDDIVEAYRQEGASPLYLDDAQRRIIKSMGCVCIEESIMSVIDGVKGMEKGRFLRHDSQKLASVIFRLLRELEE